MSDLDDKIVVEFLLESHENLETLDRELLVLEKTPQSREILSSVFRTIHTLKGTCGFLGYSKLEALAHIAEGLLGRLRSGELAFTPDHGSLLGSFVDAVREMLGHIERTRTEGGTDYGELTEALRAAQSESAPSAAKPGASAHAGEAPGEPDAGAAPRAAPRRIFDEMIADGRLEAEQVALALRQQQLGDPRRLGEILVDNGVLQPHEVLDALMANGVLSHPSALKTTIRVDVRLLERLMNQVGELVLARNQMLQLVTAQNFAAVPTASQRLNAITTELQEAILKTRMQPIQMVWSQLPRLAREVSKSCGKPVRLETEGAETELDKTLLEAIKDPLVHLVRNAIDHGIEAPEVRAARNKPAEGLLRLRAFHEGGQVVIEVADDGGGIAVERIRERALERGLVTPERAAGMRDEEWTALIFAPGFSTAASVTRVSGRGVGMDVVRTNVERIGGMLELRSRPGEGTTFQIKIPLTLAIIPALCVTSGGEEYAVPQANLLEILRVPARGIESVHGAPVHRLRGRLLPLVHLAPLLGRAPEESAPAPQTIVVLGTDGRRFGLVVDGVGDFREVVVKPLDPRFHQGSVFAGATILGDGRVALILDPQRVARRAALGDASDEPESAAPAMENTAVPLLWFEIEDGWLGAVPLAAVGRLEEIDASRLQRVGASRAVVRGDELMPVVPLAAVLSESDVAEPSGTLRILVIQREGAPTLGLLVSGVIDVVEAALPPQGSGSRFGVRGTMVIAGRATDFVDLDAAVTRALERCDLPVAGEVS